MTLAAVTRSARTWSASATSLLRSAPPISATGRAVLGGATERSEEVQGGIARAADGYRGGDQHRLRQSVATRQPAARDCQSERGWPA